MGKKGETALRIIAECRGEGVGYVAVRSASHVENLRVEARTSRGQIVPCSLFFVDLPAERRMLIPDNSNAWIVVVPLLACSLVITAMSDDGQQLRHAFTPRASKLASRLLTFTSPRVASFMRGYELDHEAGRAAIRLREAWPADGGMVSWRMQAEFPYKGEDGDPSVSIFDAKANKVAARTICMEHHVVPSTRNPHESVVTATFSCLLPESVGDFYAVAQLGDADETQAFLGMNAPRARAMVDGTRRMTAGAAADADYESWFSARRATQAELASQRAACPDKPDESLPLISVVIAAHGPDQQYLEGAVRSVVAQTYCHWELVVVNVGDKPCASSVIDSINDKRIRLLNESHGSVAQGIALGVGLASGDYVAFLGQADVLEPDALWHFANETAHGNNVDLIYCDEDRLQGEHLSAPVLKPTPNYGKLYTCNYVGHLLMVSQYVLRNTERTPEDVWAAFDYDMTLKAFEVSRNTVHIPKVLYHQRAHEAPAPDGDLSSRAHEAGKAALGQHLSRRGIEATVEDGALPHTYRVRYALPEPKPLVSIVIPTRDQAGLLNTCVQSILCKSTYPNFDVVLVENNSVESRTFEQYRELQQADKRVRVVRWIPKNPGDFNYSSVINYGASHSKGDYLILLNNDTEVIEPGWIEELMGCLMRPEVGVVGAKLLFADGLIQHVGMIAHPNGALGHVCQNLDANDLGPCCAAAMPGDYSMVTGACQMVRRCVFDELGGYDESFAVGYNDGDFCLRARETGYSVTVAPHARLYHREFATRGREIADARLMARHVRERGLFCERHASFLAHGDPYVNPNTAPYSLYGELRR